MGSRCNSDEAVGARWWWSKLLLNGSSWLMVLLFFFIANDVMAVVAAQFAQYSNTTCAPTGYEPYAPFYNCDIRRENVIHTLFALSVIEMAKTNSSALEPIRVGNFTGLCVNQTIFGMYTGNQSTPTSYLIPQALSTCVYEANGDLCHDRMNATVACGCLSSCGELYNMASYLGPFTMVNALRGPMPW